MSTRSVAPPRSEPPNPPPSGQKGPPPGTAVSPLLDLLRADDPDLIATFLPFRSGRWPVS